jgi:hypothetical protein
MDSFQTTMTPLVHYICVAQCGMVDSYAWGNIRVQKQFDGIVTKRCKDQIVFGHTMEEKVEVEGIGCLATIQTKLLDANFLCAVAVSGDFCSNPLCHFEYLVRQSNRYRPNSIVQLPVVPLNVLMADLVRKLEANDDKTEQTEIVEIETPPIPALRHSTRCTPLCLTKAALASLLLVIIVIALLGSAVWNRVS